jgi:hypothetical protein
MEKILAAVLKEFFAVEWERERPDLLDGALRRHE